MSNLYKGQINQNKADFYTRIIDSNELLEQKLSAFSFEQEAKLRRQRMEEAKKRREEAAANGEEYEPDAEMPGQENGLQSAEFQEGLFAGNLQPAPELEIDYVERAKEQAEQIISKATADAEEILKKAVQESENIKETARRNADAKGYAEGMERANAKEAQMTQRMQMLQEEQEQAYQKRLQTMEPELMDTIIEVFDQVLHSDLAGCREILLHLIRRCVQNIKNSREFKIRVSEGDYAMLSGHREEILQKIGGEVVLDIVMDESMQQGQCIIDTDEGIFDCGLDVQLENLTKDLRALSCVD